MSDATAAARGAAAELRAGLGGEDADLVLFFATPEHREAIAAIHAELRALGRGPIVGVLGAGVLAGGQERERGPALAVVAAALPGVEVAVHRVAAAPAPGWAAALGIEPLVRPALVLLADPRRADPDALLSALDAAAPGVAVAGGLASGAVDGDGPVLWVDGVGLDGGAVLLRLDGDVEMQTVVAQGARGVGPVVTATEVTRHLVGRIDGKPAVEVLDALYQSLSAEEQARFRAQPLVGLAPPAAPGGPAPAFLVRNLLGVDRGAGLVAVAAAVAPGTRLRLHLRDPAAAAEDVHAALDRAARAPGAAGTAGALLFSCVGRGQRFFGRPHHDSVAFGAAFGGLPLAGTFAAGELGPVHGRPALHAYTSVFALFAPRRWE
jgi:small ligand-binding sensory domain FIST